MTRVAGGRPAGVRLAGTGMAIPDKVVTNTDLEKQVDTSDAWIVQRTGIRQRRVVKEGETVRHLATQAARSALDNAGLQPSDLDMVIVATLTPEMVTPSTAARVVADLGADPAGAFDLSAACSGFVYGINTAAALIQSGMYRHIAVIGAETLSRIVDWDDRRSCILFGDGAGAAILSATDDPSHNVLFQSMASNGHLWQELYCPRGPEDLPPNAEGFSGKYNTLQMNGREVYKFAVQTLQACIDEALTATGHTAADLAAVVPHQSNLRILESAREKMGLPEDKMCINIDRYGNTSAASVPIALHELRSAGRVRPGDLVLLAALGGGMTWASCLWRV